MQTQASRILAEWAKHATYGVNALLSSVSRLHMDGVTVDPMPPDVTVYTVPDDRNADEPGLSMDLQPAVVPALVVWCDDEITLDITAPNYLKTGGASIVDFAYITRDTDVGPAQLAAEYTLQALRRSLWQFSRKATAAQKELNDIKVLYVGSVQIRPVRGGVGRSEMWGQLRASAYLVDTNP